jgi:hypothetical protein
MKGRYFIILLSLLWLVGCDDDENPRSPDAVTVVVTADGLVSSDGQFVVSVTQDSSVVLKYTVTAPEGIAVLSYAVGTGEKVSVAEAKDRLSYAGEIVVPVPYLSQTVAVTIEVADNHGQEVREEVAIDVQAVETEEDGPGDEEPDPVDEEGVLFFEDFEGASLKTGGSLTRGAAVMTNLPYAGEKCARANLKNDVTDPFIATTASNQTYEYKGSVLIDTDMPVTTVEWYFRFDDAEWNGPLFTEKSHEAHVDLKGGYFGWANNMVNGFYTGFRGGSTGEIRWADNSGRGDDDWKNEPWAVPGRVAFYLNTGHTWGAGTGWHKFTIKVDYSHSDYNQVKLFVDDILAKRSSGYATDGIIRVPKTWRLEHFSTSYTGSGNTSASTDRTETACGLQFDNIKISVGTEF